VETGEGNSCKALPLEGCTMLCQSFWAVFGRIFTVRANTHTLLLLSFWSKF